MVKLGNNFAEKGTKQPLLEDGFDTIPLMMPLDVNQLQFPPPEKVVVKTKAENEPDRKKGKARPPKIAEFTVSLTEGATLIFILWDRCNSFDVRNRQERLGGGLASHLASPIMTFSFTIFLRQLRFNLNLDSKVYVYEIAR
uniref:Neuronal vesicle trafficking-associated protein 1 n=1 Tax=Balaenoptera musculus TaxID=9771 RepID=A0A8C0HTV9_BALMU